MTKIKKALGFPEQEEHKAYEYLSTLSKFAFELQLYPTEWLVENAKQTLFEIVIGDTKVEFTMMTHNRLSVIVADGGERVCKKSHFILNEWNNILVSFDITQMTIDLYVNNTHRLIMAVVKPIMSKNLTKAKILLGGHSEELNQDSKKVKNLFNGLIKGV